MRIGQSKDVHRLVEGRDLIIGGVKIDYEKGLLGHSDADVLLNDKRITAAFFGNGYSEKTDKASWDKEYLDKLSYAVVAEAFNKDYLSYLYQVSDYVNGRKRGKKILIISSVLIMAIAILIIILKQH